MANLPIETLTKIFNLQQKLFEIINESGAVDYSLTQEFGENEQTITELDELQNIKQKARDSYNRLSRLLLMIAEAQPQASKTTLDLLYQSIEQAESSIDALKASTQEIKNNWRLL
jgi:hypothetical protein